MSHLVSYSKFFPPPKFLEMSAVAVEILDRGVYFLTSKTSEKGLLPDKYGFVPLTSSADLTKALIDIRKKTGANFVRFSIPEEKTYIFKTHLPTLKPAEVRNILDFKLEENVPLSSKEAVFDYDIAPAHVSGGIDPVVSVAPLKIVEEWQMVFQSAGLTPTFFGPESDNVARALIKTHNEQVVVIVNIRESSIILSLVVSRVVYQTSSINFGASTFTDLLAKYYKVSLPEALKLKKEKLYAENPDNMEIFSFFINTVSAIKDEVFKFISYCNEREDILGEVDRVILCGQDAMIVGLTRYLSSNLDLPVEVGNIWVNNFQLDDYVPDLTKLESLNYAAVNGLNLL